MLERPPRAGTTARTFIGNSDKVTATARQRRFRRRLRLGLTPVTVEVAAETIAMLIETRWLREADASDKAAIGRAIERMLADVARR
jgi:hypothetical protein